MGRPKLADLSTGPVGVELRVARTFLEEWFAVLQDELGNKELRMKRNGST
jgi:hypothetical protein